MAEHAYERRDADGNVAYSFDFPDVGFEQLCSELREKRQGKADDEEEGSDG